MNTKNAVLLLVSLILSTCILTIQTVQCEKSQYTIGVKAGDWIEYNVTTTGVPPSEKHIVWARMDILNVTGDTFYANTTGKSPNGTYSSFVRTFNFEKGEVSAWIIIPANLSPGDSFYDSFDNRNYTIEGEHTESFSGATRIITFINATDRYKQWDKATGIFVETIDNVGNYTVNARASATNMWKPQIFGLDQNVFYMVMAVAVVVIFLLIISVIFATRRRLAFTASRS